MKINLETLKTYYISLKEQPEKQERMNQMLNDIGIKNFEHEPGQIPKEEYLYCGPHCFSNAIGSGQSHFSVYEKNKTFPFLILEDDVYPIMENIQPVIDVPDECDALYLGVSKEGLYTESKGSYIIEKYNNFIEDYNEDFLRIRGMYSAHAILYINPTYLFKHMNAILLCLSLGYPFDVGYSVCQHLGMVLALKKHWFYQYPKFEESTKPNLYPIVK
jgi:hypothetical protein